MLYPLLEKGRWRFLLAVDTLGLYREAVRMALALAGKNVPFDLASSDAVIATLRGIDLVEVGPSYGQIHLDELLAERPDALKRIVWDPLVRIIPRSDRRA
jgi:hypothetical protein